MRIGLDGRFYRSNTGGIGRYSRELIENLLKIDRDNDYILFITPEDEKECKVSAPNLKIVVTDIRHFTLSEQLKLSSVIKAEKPDVMHFLNFNHPLNYSGKFITTIHDLTMNFFPVGRQRIPILRQAYLHVMRHAGTAPDAVIVPTKTVKDDVVSCLGVNPDKVHAIYEGASIPDSVSTKTKKGDLAKIGVTKPYILFVSQWRPHKGLGILVEAFNEIKKTHDIQLVVAGKQNPQFPEIPAAIEASPHRQDIIAPGFVSDDALDALYAQTELFVFPSWYEGFGLPPLEAMARGVPVAASNMSVMPEVLGDGAIYFDPKNYSDMARVINQALSDSKLLAELRKRGFAQVKKYSWKKMAQETLALYEKVAAADKPE